MLEQKGDLLCWPPFCPSPEEDDGGFSCLSLCQQDTEIRVRGYDDAVVGSSVVKDCAVVRSLHSEVTDLDCIVAAPPQAFCYLGREGVVYEEPHEIVKRGSSRSRTASAA